MVGPGGLEPHIGRRARAVLKFVDDEMVTMLACSDLVRSRNYCICLFSRQMTCVGVGFGGGDFTSANARNRWGSSAMLRPEIAKFRTARTVWMP